MDASPTDSVARPFVPWWVREYWDVVALVALALAPLLVPALGGALGGQMTTLFIYCVLALGLNVMVGYTGLVHLGIAAFFGIGAYVLAILTVPMLPFRLGFVSAAAISTAVCAAVGLALGAWAISLLVTSLPDQAPTWTAFELDARTVAFTLATSPRRKAVT